MFTIRDALTLSLLETAVVVAGSQNLENTIRWVHVIDIPDAHFQWQQSGILLLTTGFGLQDDPVAQATLIPKLVNEGFAGIVLSTGYYFDTVPEPLRQAVDKHQFPLITLPSNVLFIDVSQAILEKIINQQYNLL